MRSKQRTLTSGRVLGGHRFWRGALYHLLQNRIYRGEVVHKGIAYPGEHEAIVDEELWSAVQARLAENRTVRRRARVETGALLGGLIYDDRGNIMSPTYSVRRGNRYRYYISSALLHDRRVLRALVRDDDGWRPAQLEIQPKHDSHDANRHDSRDGQPDPNIPLHR